MTETSSDLPIKGQRTSWVRLRTLILLRWVAVIGQSIALLVAIQIYGLQLELGLCLLAIGISVTFNIVAGFVYPENKRLSEYENMLMVLFDLLQLCFLLFLTGGLNNPFSILILGPVMVATEILALRSTILVGTSALVLVSLLAAFHVPLHTQDGFILRVPTIFMFGNWVSIVIAIFFLGLYSRRVMSEMTSMSDALSATQMALAREQKLTDLGGVVAAAAHEMGTPLATIKLASTELMEELDHDPDLYEDAELIRDQADRCRDILREMGKAGKDDLLFRHAPLIEVIQTAAEPHFDRGKKIHLEELPDRKSAQRMPEILRRPEIIHGLRNLIQNAVDFAMGNVWIEAIWSDAEITIRIVDDGRGYPSDIIGRIGDPFMRRRRTESDKQSRPEYEGMGLGLFIAKTLLERSGADLTFANASDPYLPAVDIPEKCGAIVEVTWPREKIDAISGEFAVAYGANPQVKL